VVAVERSRAREIWNRVPLFLVNGPIRRASPRPQDVACIATWLRSLVTMSDDQTVSRGDDDLFGDDLSLIDLQDSLDLVRKRVCSLKFPPLMRIRAAITSRARTDSGCRARWQPLPVQEVSFRYAIKAKKAHRFKGALFPCVRPISGRVLRRLQWVHCARSPGWSRGALRS